MRLNSIKLSGFKSFADPTNFQLPGQLVGVVGPNGCGKSNIMDAVRWVLGESKASELRGESMQDVIFNGSGNRKPASRSSVELVFDNASARAGGQWNQFSEIAVKRVLTRDGTSSYFINNQPVRRRDVQDVFLGTGLGPRAYAIIGQGTISRIIESKPEELRLFLEEAAGVSKYKERRRETENRLKDTRENMTRVEDILRELGSNLEKLEKQAEVAASYRSLQDAGTLKLHQLWFLKHRDAAGEASRVKSEHLEAVNALEARLAELRALEAQLEGLRQSHYAAGDELHAAQGRFAEAQMEVSRLEERIRYVVEGRQRLQQRLAELQAQGQHWQERGQAAHVELDEVATQIAQAEEQSEILAAQAEDQAIKLPEVEELLRAAQARANEQRSLVTQVQQQIQLLAAESRNIDDQSRQLNLRRERLATERQGLAASDDARLTDLRRQLEAGQEELAVFEAQLGELTETVPALDDARKAAHNDSGAQSAKQSELVARLEALRALQEKVQTEGKLKPWLAKHGLQDLAGLWTQLHITPGWENALEAALRERMGALAVGRLETVQAFAQDAPPARLAFYSLPQGEIASTQSALAPLSAQLRLDSPGLRALLKDWLEGVYTAENMAQALAQRPQLAHGELIMTPEGHAVSQFAVSFYAPDSETAGLLARAQEIENLEREQRAQQLIADEARAQAVRAEAAYSEAAQRLAGLRREATYANLGPGHYRFRVQAARDDGRWTGEEAQLAFSIQPRLHESRAFFAACGLLVLLLLWLGYRLRLRALSARMHALLEERHRERERIARELHDTLLQSVQGLVMLFHAAGERIADAGVRQQLDRALTRAQEVIAEGRDRVRWLRVSPEPSQALAQALEDAATELLPAGLPWRLQLQGRPQTLKPWVQEELLLLAREALSNITRHACASEVQLLLAFGEHDLTLNLRDDGIGLDLERQAEREQQGHFGLRGMQERAQRIGARLTLGAPLRGPGTELSLRLDAARAYARQRPGLPWWRRWGPASR